MSETGFVGVGGTGFEHHRSFTSAGFVFSAL